MKTKIFSVVLAGLMGLSAMPGQAQTFFNSQMIIQALEAANTGPLVRSMQPSAKRGIDVQGPLPPMVDLPKINLTINFELDSANLTQDGMLALRSLSKALMGPKLQGQTFQLAGHTDGRGDAAYNMQLSLRRANTARNFLINHFGVEPHRLIAVGHGMSQMMDPANPKNPLNRRVEVINISPLT